MFFFHFYQINDYSSELFRVDEWLGIVLKCLEWRDWKPSPLLLLAKVIVVHLHCQHNLKNALRHQFRPGNAIRTIHCHIFNVVEQCTHLVPRNIMHLLYGCQRMTKAFDYLYCTKFRRISAYPELLLISIVLRFVERFSADCIWSPICPFVVRYGIRRTTHYPMK